MLRPKKQLKITSAAKEVLEELTLWQKLEAYWAANKRTLSYVGLGAVVVIIGVVMWISRQRANMAEAAAALGTAETYYDAGQYDKAIGGDSARTVHGQRMKGLQEIVDQYGGTTPGKVAALYLANSYYYKGDYDNARAQYEKAEGIGDALLSAAAYAGEGAVLESKQQYGDAAKFFERASGISATDPNDPEYLVSAARCFAKSLQVSKAVELYRRVVFEFAGTSEEEAAKHALAELHVEL